jgi:hypothetical protein
MLTDDQLSALVECWHLPTICVGCAPDITWHGKLDPVLWRNLEANGLVVKNEEAPSLLAIEYTLEITDKGKKAVLRESPVRVVNACVDVRETYLLQQVIKEAPLECLPELLTFDVDDIQVDWFVQLLAYRRMKELQTQEEAIRQ